MFSTIAAPFSVPQPIARPATIAPASAAAANPDQTAALDPSAAPAPSPRLSLDQATGLVVIEFQNGLGRGDLRFPSDKEMEAYRRNLGSGENGNPTPVPPRQAARTSVEIVS